MQVAESKGSDRASQLRSAVLTLQQCDEKRPICGKCEVHFSNIKACEYGPPPKSATKRSALPASGPNLKRTGGFPAICPRPENVIPTPLDTAKEVATMYSSLQLVHLPAGLHAMTPPPENTQGPNVSLGRSCGCPCHKTGRVYPPSLS